MRNRMIIDKLLRRGGCWRPGVMLKPPLIEKSSLSILNPSSLSCPKQPTYLFPCLGQRQRFLSSSSSSTQNKEDHQDPLQYDEESSESDGWEEEDEVDPQIGDGGDGGGVVLEGCSWGERALSIAHEALLPYADDIKLFAFKTTPRGYVYVRLDKLSHKYGCPSIEELEKYSQEYKKRLDEVGALGQIPHDLALEVSTPGAERILKVPDDLTRFKDMPMRVCYVDQESEEKDGVFLLESVEADSDMCVWKLADVRENRSRGRPLSRKKKDWRLNLPFVMHRMVTLYLDC